MPISVFDDVTKAIGPIPGIDNYTAATATVDATDTCMVFNNASANTTVTFPAAASCPGRTLRMKNLSGTYTVISGASNVVPLAGGAAGTAILAATAGKWADLESDGTNWVITAAN